MDEIPASVIDNLVEFHEKITKLEEAYKPVLARTAAQENSDPLERAKSDLLSLYALNSTFWSFLCTKGMEPKETFLVHELQMEDRSKAPKLDKRIAQSFVRNALFDHTSSGFNYEQDETNDVEDDEPRNKKRRNEKTRETKQSKKHKKKNDS
uniref:Nuclear nucleic acid-binding protein C1D n=1 Tax=Romanomermis culicivorax TaxID=13658 RepID=A0A915J6L5_ROMCU